MTLCSKTGGEPSSRRLQAAEGDDDEQNEPERVRHHERAPARMRIFPRRLALVTYRHFSSAARLPGFMLALDGKSLIGIP